MRRRVLLATAGAVAGLAFPSVALGQPGNTNPFSPGLPVSPTPTPPATTSTTGTPITTPSSGGSLGGGGIAAISIGAIVLLGGISFFIWRDARRRAPVRHRMANATGGDGARPGSKRAKPRKLSPAERRRRKRGRAR